jgi:prevent-host-death family protein
VFTRTRLVQAGFGRQLGRLVAPAAPLYNLTNYMVIQRSPMTDKTVNIAEAKAHLSELVDQAAAGDTVVLTRRGKAIARMSSLDRPRKPIDAQRLRRLTDSMPQQVEDAGALVRRMRDDERY